MEDIILVSGVLYLRPPSGEAGEDGILCDGLIEFRSSAAKPAGVSPYKKQSGVIPSPDEEEIEDEGSMG